jgi:hypothetical protein
MIQDMLKAPHQIIVGLHALGYPIAMYFTLTVFKLSALDLVLECQNAVNSVNLKHLQSVIDPKMAPKSAPDRNSVMTQL